MKDKLDSLDSERLLTLSEPPFIHHTDTTRILMLDMIVALFPALIWGIYIYGSRAAVITLLSVVCCVGFEAASRAVMKKPLLSITDLSAVVTGILIAMNIPAAASLYIPVAGAFIAVVIVKQLFGGIGKNLLNPALAATAVLTLIRPNEMVSAYSPLNILMQGSIPDISISDLFVGNITSSGAASGVMLHCTIGEASPLLLILGGIYLLIRRGISWHIPVGLIAASALFAYLFPQAGTGYDFMQYFLLSGKLVLCAVFMASDPATSPVTPIGRIVYGVMCGILTFGIRYLSLYADGAVFAVLIMNLLVHPIDSLFIPRALGKRSHNEKKQEIK